MDPDEITDQLKLAVQACQVHMESFQNTCEDSTSSVISMKNEHEKMFSGNVQTTEDLYIDETDTLQNNIKQSVNEKSENFFKSIEQARSDYDAALDLGIDIGLKKLINEFSTEQNTAINTIEEASKIINACISEHEDTSTKNLESLDELQKQIQESESTTEKHLSEYTNTIENDIQAVHLSGLEEYEKLIDEAMNVELTKIFEQTSGDFDGSIEQLIESLGLIGEELNEKFEELTLEIVEHVEDGIDKDIKARLVELIDTISGDLSDAVNTLTEQSQRGATVSAEAIPEMPPLVGFKNILEALEAAINMWKKFKNSVGV